MSKIGAVLIVVGVVIAAYLIILITHPVMVDIVATANTTMVASSNMSNYPGTSGMLVSTPWIMFFVPGVVGLIVIVAILRKP